MLTLFAYKAKNGAVDIYRDAEKNKLYATFASWNSNKPRRRNKYVTLDCYKYNLIWIE